MNGSQFLACLQGNLEIDEKLFQEKINEFKEKFPYGKLYINRATFTIRVNCFFVENTKQYICMKCGKNMKNRVNQYRKNNKWLMKKKKDNISNQECPKCYPNGYALLACFTSDFTKLIKENHE